MWKFSCKKTLRKRRMGEEGFAREKGLWELKQIDGSCNLRIHHACLAANAIAIRGKSFNLSLLPSYPNPTLFYLDYLLSASWGSSWGLWEYRFYLLLFYFIFGKIIY